MMLLIHDLIAHHLLLIHLRLSYHLLWKEISPVATVHLINVVPLRNLSLGRSHSLHQISHELLIFVLLIWKLLRHGLFALWIELLQIHIWASLSVLFFLYILCLLLFNRNNGVIMIQPCFSYLVELVILSITPLRLTKHRSLLRQYLWAFYFLYIYIPPLGVVFFIVIIIFNI